MTTQGSSSSEPTTNVYAKWFQRVLAVGMAGNTGFIVGMFLVPEFVLKLMNLADSQVIWVQAVVMLVGVISINYVPALKDPLKNRSSAVYTSIPRLASALFFGTKVLLGAPTGFLNVVLFDAVFGLAQAWLLYMAFDAERLSQKEGLVGA